MLQVNTRKVLGICSNYVHAFSVLKQSKRKDEEVSFQPVIAFTMDVIIHLTRRECKFGQNGEITRY
jgi:hypothetical protein